MSKEDFAVAYDLKDGLEGFSLRTEGIKSAYRIKLSVASRRSVCPLLLNEDLLLCNEDDRGISVWDSRNGEMLGSFEVTKCKCLGFHESISVSLKSSPDHQHGL